MQTNKLAMWSMQAFPLVAASPPPALVQVSQHVLSSGDEEGTWLIELERTASVGAPLLICTQSAIPWFFQAWLHTLRIRINGNVQPLTKVRPAQAHLNHC